MKQNNKEKIKIVVLNDGETWTGINGTFVYEITQQALDELEEGDTNINDIDKKEIIDAWPVQARY